MSHICLITPPSPFLLDERVFPALGVLRVAAVLEAAGHTVDHLDLCGVSNYEQVVRDYQGAVLFGITATTPQIPAAVQIGNCLRERRNVKTILGGPHPTLLHAAAKKGNERARIALEYLLGHFDVVVAGDGEKAIFTALHSRGLVDADDPKGILWNTSKDFTESPLPARHLIDMDSYHYSIDGAKATSMIAQLGCLTPDTPIVLSSGIEIPISEVQRGDRVRSYDIETGEYHSIPVACTYQREADDIWEVEWDNGTVLQITGEHPVYTSQGWKSIQKVEVGWFSASMRAMRQGLPSSGESSVGEILQATMQGRVAEDSSEHDVAVGGTGQDQSQIRCDDSGAEAPVFQRRPQQYSEIDEGDKTEALRYEKGKYEPHETSGSCSEGFGDYQNKVGRVFLESNKGKLEEWQNTIQSRCPIEGSTEQTGTCIGSHPEGSSAGLYIRGERSLLGGSMSIGKTQESGLDRQNTPQSDSFAWGVLAHERRSGDRSTGLLEQGMAPSDCVVEGTSDKEASGLANQTEIIWSRIISKRFIGSGTVHNITVHPIHNYIANGMLVHNCPFHCKFCGGRNSPMLRQIRVRPSESVIDEMMHLHNDYGVSGIMHFQDELNVNHRGLVDLMRKIKDTGIDWQQRGFVKAELFNEEQAEAMFAAGFRWLLCGFESAHPRILKNIAKNATREQNTNMLRLAHKHGIKVKALMSCGHPGESEETILATRDWLLEEKPDDFDLTIITVYPGTPYFDESICVEEPMYRFETNGDALYSENTDFHRDMQYYKGTPGEYKSYVWTDYLTREDICRLRDEVEAEVRRKLSIPYPSSAASINFDHSMGMGPQILRSTPK